MDADNERQEKEQRLKAAMYHTIKQIAREVEEDMSVTVSPQVLATLSESVSRQIEVYAMDLENFAKHARRTNINVDDVKLLARRNTTLGICKENVDANTKSPKFLHGKIGQHYALLHHLSNVSSEKTSQQAQRKKPKMVASKRGQHEPEDSNSG